MRNVIGKSNTSPKPAEVIGEAGAVIAAMLAVALAAHLLVWALGAA
jgi:hypothetical protein